jgi:hypothetical protein
VKLMPRRDADPGPGGFGRLLAALLAAFAVQGISPSGTLAQVVITGLLAITLLLALLAADARPKVIQAGVLVASCLMALSVVEALSGDVGGAASRLANMVLVVLAPPAVVIGVVRHLRHTNRVSVETVLGALCLYLLIGMFFAFLYGAIDRLGDDAFFANGASASVAHCIYFSFTTLATIGYGDYTAASNLGHTLSITEGLIGQVYLVTVVAVIVSNLGQARRPENGAP